MSGAWPVVSRSSKTAPALASLTYSEKVDDEPPQRWMSAKPYAPSASPATAPCACRRP